MAALQRVTIVWHDAHTMGAEEIAASDVVARAHRPQVTRSTGYLVLSDETGVTLATDAQDADDGRELTWRGVHFIPRGMIVREQATKPRKPRRRAPKVTPDATFVQPEPKEST